jgi:signal transduction histidine kinase/CheY-like chemotaxis protein
MRLFFHKTDGRHLASCRTMSFFVALLVMALLPVQAARSADTAKGPAVNLTAKERAWLKAHPKIVFGVGESWEISARVDKDGVLRGTDVDFLQLINEKTGTNIQLKRGPWFEIVEQAKAHEIDGLSSSAASEERRAHFLFSEIFMVQMEYVYTSRTANFEINELQDLKGRRVAVQKGNLWVRNLAETIEDVTIVEFTSTPECIRKAVSGDVDAAISSLPITAVSETVGIGAKIAYVIQEHPLPLVFSVRRDWPELVEIINKGLAAITEEEESQVLAKYMLLLPEAPVDIILTPEEKAWIAQDHIVRVRTVDFPPYTVVQKNAPPEGITIDYLKEISKRTGIRFDYEVTTQPFAEFLESMKEGKGPDLSTTLVRSSEREEYLSFSDGYLETPLVIFARSTAGFISDITGLIGKKVAVNKGTHVHGLLVESYPEIDLAVFDSPELALEALATSQVDAYIGNLTVSSHLIHRRGFADLHVVAPTPFDKYVLSMANRKDWPELTSIINKVLADMSPEENSAIQGKYMQLPLEQGPSGAQIMKWALFIGGPALAFMLMFVFWNRRLRREITVRKQAEEALLVAKEQAEAANKAKSMFLSNMSHELRTPLNAILGFAQLLKRDLTIGEEQRKEISIIGRSGNNLLSLINDILDISKIESGRETLSIKSFDLSAFISEISELFQSRIIDKGLFFTLEKNDDLPRYIKSDEGKFRQVLINLLGNALKFTETGSVTLRVWSDALAENIQTLHFEVEDTGIGIDSGHLEKIFDPFVQAGHVRPDLKGTGLGLSICKSFMELLGGEIRVESKPGKGSLFRVDFEVTLAETAEASVIEVAGPAVSGLEPGQSAWRILVVEDNEENRLLLNRLLLQGGFDIQLAENGEEAVTMFKQWQPHFIWMDMRMPVMDGYQATAKIRSLPGGDTVKIVAITASAFEEQRQSILEAGCDEVVHKPFQAHEIFENIREQLGVHYIYEEEIDKPPSSSEKVIDIALAKKMAASLPEQLFDELEQAAMALDMEEMSEALERTAKTQPDLADMLKLCVEEIDFSTIRRVLNRD